MPLFIKASFTKEKIKSAGESVNKNSIETNIGKKNASYPSSLNLCAHVCIYVTRCTDVVVQ